MKADIYSLQEITIPPILKSLSLLPLPSELEVKRLDLKIEEVSVSILGSFSIVKVSFRDKSDVGEK